jgi:hypothetical protein
MTVRRCRAAVGFPLGLFLALGLQGLVSPALAGGFDGYLSYSPDRAPAQYGLGVGFYAAVWPLVARPLDRFQVGLPGAWIVPENADDTSVPLCPVGTLARGWPERAPTYRDVFQTIEGGLGYWVGNQFHGGPPKFSMNATPDCYDHEVASPGWGFFRSADPLPDKLLGVAQLSNRLLVPPDGVTMQGNPVGELLGYTWMALPLTSAQPAPSNTGNKSWTLFLNSTNFKGPVAFYVPNLWSAISQGYPYTIGRGLDAREGIMGGGAMEFNTVPFFEQKDDAGVTYSKVPAIQFPVDANQNSLLVVDVTYYSEKALATAVAQWREGGAASTGQFEAGGAWRAKMVADPLRFSQDRKEISGLSAEVKTVVFDDYSFGLHWNSATGPFASFPEYYREQGPTRVAISASQVPSETGLTSRAFALAKSGGPYSAAIKGAWASPGATRGPFKAYLSDHSVVTYMWYRFVDQPALQSAQWSSAEKDKVQSLVQKMHTTWKIDGTYMAEPSRGTLVTLDCGLIVTPPAGLEIGYVPIAIRQEYAADGPDGGFDSCRTTGDAGVSVVDGGGSPETDGGSLQIDGGTMQADSGVLVFDGGTTTTNRAVGSCGCMTSEGAQAGTWLWFSAALLGWLVRARKRSSARAPQLR